VSPADSKFHFLTLRSTQTSELPPAPLLSAAVAAETPISTYNRPYVAFDVAADNN